jgi:hypothetical protein
MCVVSRALTWLRPQVIDESINTDVAEVSWRFHSFVLFLNNRQGLFKPAEAPKNMAPVDTTTTAMALSSESARGNHLTGRCS